jgi:SPP1 gp7 family putative phage head morphogenesis protein
MADLKKNSKALNLQVSRMNAKAERELIASYARALKDVRAQLGEVYAKYQVAGTLTYAEMAKYGRLDALFTEINSQIVALTGKAAKEIVGLEQEVYQAAYYRTAFAIEFAAQAKLGYTLLNKKLIEASVMNNLTGLTLNERLRKHRADIIIKIRSEITQGLIKGEGYGQVANRIKDALEGDLNKARVVVRTESHRNQNQGMLDSMSHAEDKGLKIVKVWMSTLDSKTRDSHDDMDGQKVPIDEPFVFVSGDNKGEETDAPGLSSIPEEDINCRCTMREEIEGYEPNVQDKNEGEIPDNFDDWSQDKNFDIAQ